MENSFSKENIQSRRDLLRRINSLRVNGRRVSESHIFGDYNVWQFFQHQIFFHDIPNMGRMIRRLPGSRWKYFMFAVFVLTVSLVSFLYVLLVKRKIIIFTNDKASSGIAANDFRMDPIYRVLVESGQKYIEVMHTLGGRSMVRNFIKRGRPVIYLEALDLLYTLVCIFKKPKKIVVDKADLLQFSQTERDSVSRLLSKYTRAIAVSELRVTLLSFVIKRVGANLVLSIDDPRHSNELMLAAELNSVDSFAFQHGIYTEDFLGYLKQSGFTGRFALPKHLFVWSEYWKKELLSFGACFSPNQILIGGFLISPPNGGNFYLGESLSVLIPYEALADRGLMKKYILKIMSKPGSRVFFKVRGDLDKNRQLEEYGLSKVTGLVVVRDVESVIDNVGVVLGTHSTLLFDMVGYNKPIALIIGEVSFAQRMLDNDLAQAVSFSETLVSDLLAVQRTTQEVLVDRRYRLFGRSPTLMLDTVQGIIESH